MESTQVDLRTPAFDGPGISAGDAVKAPASSEMSSHRHIFRSTVLVGGAQVLCIGIGVVKTKVLAVLLGPSGVGLTDMYQSATGLVGTLTGMGIRSAGVRQIAEAASSGDEDRIARVITTLRRVSLLSGLCGMMIVLLFCKSLSHATFGDGRYAWSLGLVSLTLLFGGISAGQNALLQGLRRLKDLVSQQVLGSLLGSIAAIILVYYLRDKGVVWFVVAASAVGVLTSWWYARRVRVKALTITMRDSLVEARELLGMGVAFMTASLMSSAVVYLTRILVIRSLGMEAVGLYAATSMLSSVYVGIILNAMGADFYPRLTGVATDNAAVNRLVNEQTVVGLLIAVPGVLATLVFAPFVMRVLYSDAFLPAIDVIRWQVLGVALRVVSWPLSYVQLAKGMPRLYAFVETCGACLSLGITYACMRIWGLEGLGIAFAAFYVAQTAANWLVCKRISRFVWHRRSKLYLLCACGAVLATLASVRMLPLVYGYCVGGALASAVSTACLIGALKLLHVNMRTLFAP